MVYRPDYFRPPDLETQWDLIEEYPLGLMALSVEGRPAAVAWRDASGGRPGTGAACTRLQ